MLGGDYTCGGYVLQGMEVRAAKMDGFEQTLFSFFIPISVIIWIFGGRNSLFYEQTLFTSIKWEEWCESACSMGLEVLQSCADFFLFHHSYKS